MVSRTETRVGGGGRDVVLVVEVGETRRCFDTGRATARVAKVIDEIHREDSRGSSEDGNRAQNLQGSNKSSERTLTRSLINTYAPARIGAELRI